MRGRASRRTASPVAATDPLYILYTSGTTGKPKGVVRDNGGHAVALHWSMQHVYDTRPGRGVLGRLRRRLGRRALLHRVRAAAGRVHDASCTRASRSAPRTPARSGGSCAEHGVQGAVHRADRVPGDQEGGPGGRSWHASTTCPRCVRCSWPASGSTRTPTTGPPSCSASRSSTTGGRPRPAGRSPRTCSGLEPMPTKAGLADRADARLRRAGPRRRTAPRSRPDGTATIVVAAAAAAGHAADAVARRRAVRRRRTCRASRATT